MTTRTHSTSARRFAAAALVAVASFAGAACAPPAPPEEPSYPAGAPYNNCSSQCIILAEVNTSGRTVTFRGETKDIGQPSQWFLWVYRDGVEIAARESGALSSNRYDADLGVLPAGGAYQLAILAGTNTGDQLRYLNFTTGPEVTATPTSTNVSLAFSMDKAVTANAQIRRTDGTMVANVTGSGPSAVQNLVSAATLDPSTAYTYRVNATDAQGRLYVKDGSFVTRGVRLEVQLTSIQVTDDSDYFGAGELKAQLHVGGAKAWIWENEKSVDSGQYFTISTTAALPTAVRSVPISVVVADDDCEGIGSLCTGGTGNLPIGSGSNDEAQWATATHTANLPATTVSTPWTSFLSSTTGGPLSFAVTGQYRWVML